ncbi:MAG: hypothetical protein ACI84C_002474, partial [Flavobacteriales bacterium]
FCTESEFERAYQTTRRECQEPMDLIKFTAKVAGFLGTLQDSHTYLQYKSILGKHAKSDGKYYGFVVKAIGSDIFIASDAAGLLSAGSKLVSINGIRATVLFNEVNKLSVQEGNSLTGRRRISEILFSRFGGIFSEIADSNKVEFIPFGQDSLLHVWYPGKTAKEWRKEIGKSTNGNLVKMTFNDTVDIAVLRIPSFAAGKDRKYYKGLRKSFKELSKRDTQHLAIDLRGNTGGKSERMEQLFAYLTEDTICTPANIIVHQSELSRKRFDNDLNSVQYWLMRHAPKKSEDLLNYITMMDLELGQNDTVYYTQGEHIKSKRVYKNNSYLLMDGSSGSASANFAGTFQIHELGEIWGEPCLGPPGGTWGNPAGFTLPKSGIGVYISTIRFNNSNLMLTDSNPVRPNHRIEINPKSLADETDIVLEKLIESISKSK